MRRANEKRFTERLSAQFEQYRQQRLANSEAECRKLISDITTRLTQVSLSGDHGPARPRSLQSLALYAGGKAKIKLEYLQA